MLSGCGRMKTGRPAAELMWGPLTSLVSERCLQEDGWGLGVRAQGAATICAHESCRQGHGIQRPKPPSQEGGLILTTSPQVALLCSVLQKVFLAWQREPAPTPSKLTGVSYVRAGRPSRDHGLDEKTETQRRGTSRLGLHRESEQRWN